MAEIVIKHEIFSDNSISHIEKVKFFKEIAKKVLSNYPGLYEFEYISKYGQFDFVKNSEDIAISKKEIELIEKEIPNCFV